VTLKKVKGKAIAIGLTKEERKKKSSDSLCTVLARKWRVPRLKTRQRK